MITGKGFVMMAMIMPCTDTMKSSCWHYSRKRKTKRRANLPLVVTAEEEENVKKSQTRKKSHNCRQNKRFDFILQ